MIVKTSDSSFNRVLETHEPEEPTPIEEASKVDKGYNPRVGIPILLLHQLFFCISRTCTKYLYISQPEMSTSQFLFIQASVGFLFNCLMTNTELKRVVWDSVTKENRSNLLLKVLTSKVTTFMIYSAIKYFPLTYLEVNRGVAPFFVLFLSCLCLGEPPNRKQVIVVSLVVAFSMGFVLTGETNSE